MVACDVVETLSIACDFDGTITCRDTLHLIVEAFGAPGVWSAIEPRLFSGEISLEQAMEEQFASVRATPEQVAELVREHAGLRPGFHEFERWAAERGHRLVVLSSGFRGVIERLLGEWGLDHLELVSHEALFSDRGCTLVWSDRGPACAECGRSCKRHEIRRLGLGRPLVYIGDGVSDRCASKLADLIFARADLARHLTEDDVPFVAFEDFDQVRARLRRPVGMAA
jgi:2-hydroxy-3-keto-5-methylthiopentenyl-1-phosphate phosphatase